MAETDAFNFSKLKIFEGIKNCSLPDDAKEVFDIFDDLIFIWDFELYCINVINYRRLAQSKSADSEKVQSLLPASNLKFKFTVSKILISYGGSYCAISGSQGLSLLELPSRWGADGLYNNGSPKVTCRVFSVHEYASNQLEVVQLRWHPASPTDSHLLVLYSDNSLRLYENEGILKQTWRVGPMPNVGRKLSFLKTLGDTAIDFDICPAQVHDDIDTSFVALREDKRKIEWPVVILRGNGTVYVLCCGFNSEKARLQGPLTMIPSQKNNYGDDSCSLLVIPSLPITIVVAESSGILHHALLIENKLDDTSFDDMKVGSKSDWSLYVLENIELELGLWKEKEKEENFHLYLKKDPVNENRYFCYHEAGLHGITMNFIHQLQKFCDDENEENIYNHQASRVEHILTTRAFSNSKETENAIIGLGVLQSPSGILAWMRSGQVVSLSTIKSMPLSYFEHTKQQVPNLEQKVIEHSPKITFDQHIKMLLNASTHASQPLLKLDKSNVATSKQAFHLLMNSIQTMRETQFNKHDNVRQEIMKRVKILEVMKNQQQDEIAALLECKKMIQENAYRLADKHEDIMERQNRIQDKIESTCRLLALKLPSNSANEKEFSEHIKRLKTIAEKLNQDVSQIKMKHESQKNSLSKSIIRNDDGPTNLPSKQEESIKELMKDMMRQIQSLKSDVQNIYNVIEK